MIATHYEDNETSTRNNGKLKHKTETEMGNVQMQLLKFKWKIGVLDIPNSCSCYFYVKTMAMPMAMAMVTNKRLDQKANNLHGVTRMQRVVSGGKGRYTTLNGLTQSMLTGLSGVSDVSQPDKRSNHSSIRP